MLLAQARPDQNLCRPYSRRVLGTHLSMDLFLDHTSYTCGKSEASFIVRITSFFLFFNFRIAEDDKSMYVPDIFSYSSVCS